MVSKMCVISLAVLAVLVAIAQAAPQNSPCIGCCDSGKCDPKSLCSSVNAPQCAKLCNTGLLTTKTTVYPSSASAANAPDTADSRCDFKGALPPCKS